MSRVDLYSFSALLLCNAGDNDRSLRFGCKQLEDLDGTAEDQLKPELQEMKDDLVIGVRYVVEAAHVPTPREITSLKSANNWPKYTSSN